MSTWNCPICGATNPAPIHSRQKITCVACAESFDAEYNHTVTSKTVTVELTSKHYKKKQVACYILMLLGVSGCVVGGLANSKIIMPGGFISFWIGAIWLLIVRVQIWLNHGWYEKIISFMSSQENQNISLGSQIKKLDQLIKIERNKLRWFKMICIPLFLLTIFQFTYYFLTVHSK